MVMNVAANILGLGNAATPFGIKAMEELERLNRHKGTASNAQVLFLALNTAGITLVPTKVVALRASMGAHDPAAVVAPTLFATLCATAVAVLAAKGLQRLSPLPAAGPEPEPHRPEPLPPDLPGWAGVAFLAALVALVPAMLAWSRQIGPWIVPGLVAAMIGFGLARRVRVYEVFVDGAKEGFQVAVRIIPYLVAILVAVGMLRASGALDMVLTPIGRLTEPLGVPALAVAMAGLRTLSGSGAYGMLADAMKDPAVGPDSFLGTLMGTIYGSTETTFYVLAVYFGAVQVRRIRHALAAGLLADLAGLTGAVLACRLMFG
jgi:spore maturation protein SpmB